MSFDNDGEIFCVLLFHPSLIFDSPRLMVLNILQERSMNIWWIKWVSTKLTRRQENISKLWKFDKIKFVFTYEGHFFLSFPQPPPHSPSCSLKSIFFVCYSPQLQRPKPFEYSDNVHKITIVRNLFRHLAIHNKFLHCWLCVYYGWIYIFKIKGWRIIIQKYTWHDEGNKVSIPRSYFWLLFYIFAYTFGGYVWCGATLDINKFNGNKIGKIFNLKKFAWIEKWKKKSDGKKNDISTPPPPPHNISCLLCRPFANIIFYSPQLAHILQYRIQLFNFSTY